MNIGIFTDTYFPQINGVATSSLVLKKELEKLGHKVYIFTTADSKAEADPTVFRVPGIPLSFLPTHRLALLPPPRLLLKIRELDLDIVHTQTEFSMGILGHFVAKACDIPHVHTFHTMYVHYVHYIAGGHLISPNMVKYFLRVFCNSTNLIVAPNAKARDSLIDYGVKRPIRIIPTGIDFKPFIPDNNLVEAVSELKSDLGIPQDYPTVVTVGRLSKEKSVDVILDGFAKLLKVVPQACLIVVGGGPALESLQEQAAFLDISDKVIFTGFVSWNDVGKYYQLGDVFVSASTTETQGLTYFEAMAAHVPVIAKNDPSTNDLIKNRVTGFLFDNDEELPSLLYDVLGDKAIRRSVSGAAYKSISPLSAGNFGKCIERLYNEVVCHYPETYIFSSPEVVCNVLYQKTHERY